MTFSGRFFCTLNPSFRGKGGNSYMSRKKKHLRLRYSVSRRYPLLKIVSVIILTLLAISIIMFFSLSVHASELSFPTATPSSVEAPTSVFPEGGEQSAPFIFELQSLLNNLGYTNSLSGTFDETTAKAVKAFQFDYDLAVDGVVGEKTAETLGLNLAAGTKYFYAVDFSTIARNTDKTRLIYISLRSKTLSVFLYDVGQNAWELYGSYPCAIGAPNSPTPVGVFYVYSNTYEYFKHGEYLYYTPSFFNDNVGIHSVAFDPETETWFTEVLGEAVSLGCIRVEYSVASWIQENCPLGTPVIVDDRAYDPLNVLGTR